MKRLVIITLLVVTTPTALQGYKLPNPKGPGLLSGDGYSASAGNTTTSVGQISTGQSSGQSASEDSSEHPHSTVATGASHNSLEPAVSGTEGFTLTGSSTGSGASLVSGTTSGSEVVINTGSSSGQGHFETPCKDGEIRHVDGSCIVPEITRKVFVVSVPKQTPQPSDSLPDIPPPRVDHNILFVRLPEGGVGPDPIVVPPPRQNNIVYVLSKNSQNGQRVIEVPAPPPSEPEIYFVNYDDGENPTLPGGVDLETALGSALEANGQVIAQGFGDNLTGSEGITGSIDIGNVAGGASETSAATFIDSNTGISVSGSASQGSQIGITTNGNTYSSSSQVSTSPASESIQSGGSVQGSQTSYTTSSASTASSFTTPSTISSGNTGSFQSGGISTGSQFAVTTADKSKVHHFHSSDAKSNPASYTTFHDSVCGKSCLPPLHGVDEEHLAMLGQSLQSTFSICDPIKHRKPRTISRDIDRYLGYMFRFQLLGMKTGLKTPDIDLRPQQPPRFS
ncbi:uncharacterized protein LOC122257997 [Penaeus japonicus]|uniref:uncharacterized protein LOC122257997 n=1 Tax=Penaeus japonicus TaxID=27405 RepID=UPI001C70FB45|nr:uncharacterized protein LOC122257997 [Penaeus japonicus]